MATGIPTFKVDIQEGIIDVDTSADRLFAYCIEADRGPENTPYFVASNKEAQRVFGEKIDFAPHFYQKPTGLILVRVGFEGSKPGEILYKGNFPGQGEDAPEVKKTILTIKSTSPGPCEDRVVIQKALVGDGFSLFVDIHNVVSKSYQNISSIRKVAERINKRFGDYLEATLEKDTDGNVLADQITNDKVVVVTRNYMIQNPDYGKLANGTNGYMLRDSDKEKAANPDSQAQYVDVDDSKYGLKSGYQGWIVNITDSAEVIAEKKLKPNPQVTLQKAYTKAFEASSYVDVIGVAALSKEEIVRNVLRTHINYMVDPEVHTYRFGITSVLPSDDSNGVRSKRSLCTLAEDLNSEWIICIGQGVVFQKENEQPVNLEPYQAVQLYTGIRSSLGYSEAIFGGEQKKVLRGVVDTLDITNDNIDLIKDDIIDLNEAGICTFKKEYNEITFVEGVTTIQEEDVMSYENLMSIIAYVVKRLVKIAKPYQGQRLTEDLKSTLQTALSAELKTITESDGTLMALEEFNIPPYDVQVYSAGKTKFDETNHLVRESKIIIQCRIVPVGALRDIDLHVIAI